MSLQGDRTVRDRHPNSGALFPCILGNPGGGMERHAVKVRM